ncbi:MAG TPA: glycosyltransferase family 4 protein [Acholeplasmataceae bacterium]|nr:glycosyltransferase family 4 protein [Acholeplasmataceae bacterium]
MGLPCISTDYAGSNEIIVDGENGLLVSISSEEKLAEAMKLLILNQQLALQLST